jgi:phosphate transport system permease protein
MFAATPLVRKKLRTEKLVMIFFALMAAAMVAPLIGIVAYLVAKAWPVLSWEFLTTFPRNNMKAGGIFPALAGTFFMVLTSLAISTPIGVLAAVYLNEYARDNWFTRVVNLAVVNLAGVPSIVYALFGVGAFVLLTGKPCILAASMTLGLMTLPVIIASTKQALAAVPMSFREACWNVGASRLQTIRTIVLPNSLSGILTGIILQVSRAAGETAPILFTGAVFFRRELPSSVLDQSMALSMHLFSIATQGGQVPESLQYGTAVALLGLVLVVNLTAILLRIYFRSRKKW